MARSKSFGGSIALTGESEYQKALRGISDNLKVLGSEMKAVTSAYNSNDKSVSNLYSQQKLLNKQIAEQKEAVKTYEKALADAEKETGANSGTTKKWQYELNNAKAKLNDLESNLNSNKEAIKNFGKEEDDASQKTIKFGDIIKANLISEIIIGGIKALGSAMKTMGSAFVDVGKQALSSYADYEQLKGGIDTLFKDSADKVIENANNAFATTGLSANAYMENVMGFSASLLQSLGGDTAKASEVANMALIDMSDNANKFGTDMASVQNAYQSFAKGQYQLLDNLKLGYGGTKEEMQRLLADAQKITGVKYDIKNLNDVYQAIHVIQGELGITGTTSKEASTTIQGSTIAMKSAWQNLLTGIADDNANFDVLVSNFTTSLLTMSENILPRISTIASGLGKLVGGLASSLLSNLPTIIQTGKDLIMNIGSGITSAFPTLIPIVQELVGQLFNFFSEQAPLLIDSGVSLLETIGQGLVENIPQFISKGLDLLQNFADFLTENVPILIQSGISFVRNMVQGLVQALPELISRVPVMISQFANVINDNAPTIIQGGIGLIWDLIKGLISAIPTLIANIPQIIQAILDVWQAFNWIDLGKNVVKFLGNGLTSMVGFAKSSISNVKDGIINFIKDLPNNLFNIGKNAISNLGGAIQSMLGWIKTKAVDIGTGVINSIKGVLSWENIKQVGINLVKGLWNGISDMTGWIIDKVKGFGSSVLGGIKKFFGINSPSKLMENEVGKYLAQGVGVGFSDEMKEVTDNMASAIPTNFDATITGGTNTPIGDNSLISAFKVALKDVKVVMNDRELGTFVVDTMGKVVYS